MELKQQLKMSQQLVMTPQLQQAIKLLQMSRAELVEMVNEELLENPVLEATLPDQAGNTEESAEAGEAGGRASAAANGSDGNAAGETKTIDQAIAADDRAADDASKDTAHKRDEIDWEQYIENHAMQAPLPGGIRPSEDLPSYEATLTKTEDLSDHLSWQINMSDFVEEERRFAALVIGNLDDRGYLTVDGVAPEDVVPRLAHEAEIDPEDAEEVLHLIQQLDPIGVGARDLRECLLIQARIHGMDQLVLDVLEHHLQDLERRNYQAIAKGLGVTLEEVYDVAQVICEFEPRPARNFVSEETVYIEPDVHVHKVGDSYFVAANDDGMPRLKISSFYRSAMQGDERAREYIQNKLRSAQWLIRSIDQRRKTIERVTECIVRRQEEFFEQGIEYLKPMILRDVADEVGMHESTISRVTSNKYVNTPRGLFELKYFFNSAIRRGSQEDIASESVKQAIKKLIDSEQPDKPYSDQKIVELLGKDDIHIARRTVAKYREMLGILSSSKRKKYF